MPRPLQSPPGHSTSNLLNQPCNSDQLVSELCNTDLGVEYQPIVNIHTGDILGYEALARFYHHSGQQIAPAPLFEALHQHPQQLAEVELQLKRLQLAQAPCNSSTQPPLLFINLDPHAISESTATPLFKLLDRQTTVVIELIENTDIHDARASSKLHQKLRQLKLRTALDDIGSPDALLSFDILTAVDYLKFDRYWINQLAQPNSHPHHAALLCSLVDFAKASGKKTILEGIETGPQLRLARQLGVDYVQGFYYRDQFINHLPANQATDESPHKSHA